MLLTNHETEMSYCLIYVMRNQFLVYVLRGIYNNSVHVSVNQIDRKKYKQERGGGKGRKLVQREERTIHIFHTLWSSNTPFWPKYLYLTLILVRYGWIPSWEYPLFIFYFLKSVNREEFDSGTHGIRYLVNTWDNMSGRGIHFKWNIQRTFFVFGSKSKKPKPTPIVVWFRRLGLTCLIIVNNFNIQTDY